ncbi:MAG: hypothetical protein ACR2OU_02800 [Thermomicrobiales bacterium]
MLLTIAFISFLGMLLAMILAPSDKGSTLSTPGKELVDVAADVFVPAAQM